MNWREKDLRFSIRKLKVAVASVVVGLSLLGLNQASDGLTVVQADQQVSSPSVSDSAQAETVRVDYIYVNYNDLTAEQRQLLRRTDEEFSQVRAEKDISYVLVYRPEPQQAQVSQPLQQVKIGHLPKTGDKDGALVSLLAMSGIVGLIVLVRKQHKKTALTVLVVTGMGTGLLASDVSQALETGLKHFLIETHQVLVGEQLPQPSYRIDGLDFTYYIPQSELEGQSLNKPSGQLDQNQPTVPGQTGEQGQVANPPQPSQPSPEQTGTAEQPATPPQPLQPTEPGQPELTTELQEIDFATEIIDDANLSLGQEVVAQEGRKGQKRLTFNGDQLVSEEVLEQPVNRVILRGTKSAAVTEETRLEALPFTTEYQDDPTLAQGEEQVVREGQVGLRQDRYVNGQVVASEVLREPVNRLVKRGTKVDQPAPVESTVYENVAFETIVEPDPSLPLGQEVVVQEGQNGRKESKYLDGQLVSSVILDAPVAQIIRRGTKVEGQEPVETVTYDEVAFESIVEEDPSLPVGEEVLVQAGQVGRKENKFLDGQLVSSQIVQEPVNQIIRKGTRVIEGTVEVSREVELPFDTKVVADDSQYTDYQVTTPGQNGKAIVIDTYRTVNGVQVGLPISSRQETLVAPVDQVLTVGTKPIVDQTTVETLIEVQPDLETRYDENQYEDYNVTTPGQVGQIKRTETYVTVKGEKTGLPLDSKDEVISPATPTVVTIGTKPLEGTVDLSRLVELAFGTDTVTDENQYEDFTETIPGTPGQQEIIETFKTLKGEKIGEPIATAEGAVTAPVNAKIVTGTKPIVGSVEETREEDIAFTTETQYDDTKYTDYISETPGQLGAKILTEAFQTIKGEKVGQPTITEERVTKEPVNHVIVIGTKPIEDTVLETRTEAYTVEPETRYAEEEYEDYSVEIEGTPGTKEISERFQTIKGEKVGQPSLVGENILVPATPKVFLIGSKAIEGQVTETRKEVIEPETVIVYDDTKYEDYREEIAGTPGEKEITETFRTLKGDKTKIILESSEQVLAEPIAKQIILGRMALAGVESTERIMEVAYVTRLVEDPDQYFGYRKEEGGTPGQTKVYETYQTIKGVRTGEPTLDREEVLTAPVDLVVTVGVKPIVATEEDRQVIALPFNTTTVKDETKYTDYREVTTKGQDGQLERVTTYRTVRGQRVGEPISVVDETLNEPVDEVITIGTKAIEGEITLPPRTEERDFAVERLEDLDQYTDYYHEEGGVKGEVQITETFKTIKGQVEGNPIKSEERVITAPVKKVITVGTKPLNGQTQVVREEAIPFDTEVKYDKDQYEDYAVETGGTPGKAEITETYNTFKGEAIGQPTASERVVKEEPVNNIRTVGTKPINWTETVMDKVAVPFDTIQETDADQYEDYEVVRVEGVEGEKTITTVYKTVKGVRQPDPTITEETTKPVVNKVIVKGTKSIVGSDSDVTREPIPHGSREVTDETEYTDYREVTTEGKDGVVEITKTYRTEKGVRVGEPTVTQREVTPATEEVITVGTKPIYGEKPVISTEPIPVTEEIQLDPNKLASSPDEVLREGTEGIRTITKTYKTEKGVIVGDPIAESSAITTPMETRLIKRGAKVLEAEKQEPRAVVQTVALTAEPIAEQSIQPGLQNVRSYTWKENAKPSTTESSDSVSGTVIVTYTDGSTDEVPVTIIVRSEADKQAPTAKEPKQVVGLNSTPSAEASIDTTGLTNVRSYDWLSSAPETTASNPDATGTVRVTYTDGSYDDIPVSIIVQSEADKQAPNAKADQQVLDLNQVPVPSASIATEGLTNVDSYTWLGEAPSTAASNANVPATVRVTYTDGSYDDVPVSIKVVSEADKQAPAAKEPKQVVGLNSTPSAEASIATEGLTNVASYTWVGEAPSTAASNANVPATVRVTYTDGSYDDVPVSIKVVAEADKQTPTAKEPKQVVGLNSTPSAEASIETSGLTNVRSYDWVGSAPTTTASNSNATGTVRVTYTDGSYDDVPVSIIVQSEADKQAPIAKEPKQVVGLNSTPSAEASIETSGLTNVRSYDWFGSAPTTTASNSNATGTVRVTYTDGSYDDVPVSIIVQSEADKQAPTAKEPKQVVGLNSTLSAEASIDTTGLTNVRSYDWVGSAPTTTASNPNATGTVRVTYTDGSYDDVPVSIIVQSEADKQNPIAKEPKQVVGLNSTPSAEASIETSGLTNIRSYDWVGSAPTTTASNPNATGTVRVTYTDGSYDDVPVSIKVVSEADKQAPAAKVDQQVLGLNQVPVPSVSIATEGLTNVDSYTWLGEAPSTVASSANVPATVRVTYTDGSYDDVPVSIKVVSEADKQAPAAKADQQVLGLNQTPVPSASISTDGLTNVASYTWVGEAPSTAASNANVPATVRVTYTDGSYDDVPVSIKVVSEADKQAPTAKEPKQVVGLNSTPSAEASIETTGLTNVRSYDWLGSAPATTASNQNATGTVRVTYTDGSYDDVPVSITVQSEADKQNPTAKAEKQVVGLNVTPDPEASINTAGLERVRSYTWKPDATPVTTASNPAATGIVLVTYEDGSVDEVSVEVIVSSEADKQNPTAKAEKQVVGLNVTPDPEASINTTSLERVRSYTWKSGATPVTTASNPAATGTVLVTYEDGSVDEVAVEVIVRSEANQQTPTAKSDKQVVGLNSTPSAEASIDTTGLTNVDTYTWVGSAPTTTASNPNATGTVRVTYTDGSYDDVPVSITVQSEADKQAPTAKADKQVVGLNVTPDPEASIETTGLERVRSYTWKSTATPVTTASNPAATGTVLVTYEDGSVDEVAVEVVVQSEADKQTPAAKADKQVVGLNSTPSAEASIDTAGLTNVRSYDWVGSAPATTASNPNATGTVRVTYNDGSYDDVPVSIIVQSDADRGNPTPATVKQSVKVDQQPVAADSINKEGLAKAATYEWKTAPDTSAAVTDLDAIVVVTYEDGSKDEVPVKIDVLPNKTKPTLVLEKLTELDDDKKINLNYELTDPTNAKTSITYEIYNGTEKVKEGTVDSNNPFDVDGLDWHIPYTLKTTMTYDLGQGPVVETLEDVPFELEYKRIEIRHVDAAELYHKQSDGSYSRVDKLSTAPSDFDHYYVKVVDDKQKDIYLAVTKVEDSMVGDRATFKFTALAPQLIEHNATKTDNVENYTFHVPKVVPSEPGKPRNFSDLIDFMRASPTARIELTEDLDVGNFALANNAASYIPGNFNGQLIGNNFSIKGLKAPLFENTGRNFRAQDIFLKDVAINLPAQSNFGALAKASTGGVISNVAVQGTLNGDASLAGLVAKTTDTRLENVAFTGAITSTNQWNYNYTAGIVGQFEGTSVIDKAIVDAKITVTLNQNLHVKGVGAVVGRANNTVRPEEGNIRNVVATGSVTNTWNAETNIGGLVGEVNQNNLRLRNVVSSVNVTRGQSLIGKMGVATNVMNNTVVLVEGTTATGTNNAPTTKTATEAAAQVESMGITVKSDGSSRPNINKYDVDYTTVAGYNPANDLKYANTEKLLPFYNKEFIVKQGNLLTTGRLASEKVVSVVPMVDNKTVSDYVGQKDAINKLLIHYADGTVEELTLSFKETFKDTGIQEYRVNGGEVLFTPNQMTNRNQEIVDAVRATLQGLDYYDANILTKLKKTLANGETAKDAMDKLYLRESFNDVKAKLPEFLSGILATSNVVTTSNQELAKFITDNKEELMIGLAYVNRWYNINFGDFNAKDLILNNQDFYGKPVDTLNFLVNLAKGGYNDMRAHNNVATYAKHFAPLTGKATLFDYLGDLRQKFTKFATDAEWFNATTKAHIVETKSVHLPEVDLSAYNRMARLTDHQNGVLPLLTAQEGVYILSNLSTMIYGMFDRYFDTSVKSTDPATFEREVARVKAMANEAGKEIGVYFDTWYRLNPNNKQNILPRTVPVWDAYSNSKGTYLKRWGDVDTNQAIQDFFGPILPDITANSRDHNRGYHMRITNGSSGVAYGDYSTHMLTFNLLEKRGLSIFTHENIHNMDADFYLGGYDRRLGLLKEFYPLGLLQAPEGGLASNPIFSFNTMFDFTATADAPNRYVNASPSRFQTQKDLQDYMKGSFDVLYLLDYAEATAVLGQSNENKKKFWAKLEDRYEANSNIPNAFAINTIRSLTDDELAQLTDINSLIDGNIIARREHIGTGATRTFTRDGYFRLGLFSPIYSAHSNPDGSPGDLMFRRMSFELLAAKGYDQGFLPYASNQLADQAAAANRYGTDTFWFNRRLPFPTDDMVFKHIFAGSEHTDWADFKKDMFQERIAKKDKIKPITVTYHNRTETIDSFARLQTLMNEAVSYDAVTVNAHDIRVSRVHALKAAIYNAYLRQSKDFVESIFTD